MSEYANGTSGPPPRRTGPPPRPSERVGPPPSADALAVADAIRSAGDAVALAVGAAIDRQGVRLADWLRELCEVQNEAAAGQPRAGDLQRIGERLVRSVCDTLTALLTEDNSGTGERRSVAQHLDVIGSDLGALSERYAAELARQQRERDTPAWGRE
jgi:hypothetical protein